MPDTPLFPGGTDRKIAKPWYRRRIFQIAAAAAACAVIVAVCLSLPAANTVTVDASSLDTGDVVRAPYQDYVALRAAVAPLDVTYITAETNGRVLSVSAQDGEMVTPGQVLAQLGNPDLTLQVTSQQADISGRLSDTNSQLMALQSARENRDQTMADVAYALHKAQEELSKRQVLRDQGILNDANVKPYADEVAYQQQRLDALKAAQPQETQFYDSQAGQIRASAGDLRRSLDEVRAGLSALNLTAPATGRLTDFDLKPGQAVKQGDPIAEVDSEGTWKLRADVDEYYLARLSPGLAATANVHGKDMPVHISKVFPQVSNGHVAVELEFDQMPSDLKRGESFDVRLSLGATQEATLVPAGSWLSDSNGTSIFVLNAAGTKADRRTVTVGRRNPEYAEILAGLKPGEHVITGGTSNYVKAQHLRFNKSTQP